ncbi:hypothetical protein FRC11_011756, partial [Ceratobasidium sp. 423]
MPPLITPLLYKNRQRSGALGSAHGSSLRTARISVLHYLLGSDNTPSCAPSGAIRAPVKPKESAIPAGSGASKYVGMTATDLNSWDSTSPTWSTSTPLGTPKVPISTPTPRTGASLPQPGRLTPKANRSYNPMPPPPTYLIATKVATEHHYAD